jgi:hypothetical protein
MAILAIGAATYTSIDGFKFFVFRETGQGETPKTQSFANDTDNNFLARRAAAQHQASASTGRHAKVTGSQ